jgi:hypothetical protein
LHRDFLEKEGCGMGLMKNRKMLIAAVAAFVAAAVVIDATALAAFNPFLPSRGTDGVSGPVTPNRPPTRDPFRPPLRSPFTP